MADRHAAPSRTGAGPSQSRTGAGSRSGSSTAAGAGAGSSTNSVRRNLFQSQLTRRPTAGTGTVPGSGASSSSSSNNSAETLRLDMHTQAQNGHVHHPQQYHGGGGGHSRSNSRSGPSTTHAAAPSRSRSNTNATTESRSESPALGGGGDIVIRDTNGEIYFQDPPTPPLDELDEIHLDNRQEAENERQRLAEAVRQHQIDQNSVPVQPEELLEAVRASLRAKVAALAEDNWMYEREDPPRLQ